MPFHRRAAAALRHSLRHVDCCGRYLSVCSMYSFRCGLMLTAIGRLPVHMEPSRLRNQLASFWRHDDTRPGFLVFDIRRE